MLHIDLLCDAELRPRLRLLQQYMQTLGVKLYLHTEAPAELPPVLIVAPAPNSLLDPAELQTEHVELIGLYLEQRSPPIEADYEVHIPTWPARSSDPDVEALAKYLTQTHTAELKQDPSAAQRTSKRTRREKIRNRLLLLVLVVLFAGLTQLESDPDDETPEEQEPFAAAARPAASSDVEIDPASPAAIRQTLAEPVADKSPQPGTILRQDETVDRQDNSNMTQDNSDRTQSDNAIPRPNQSARRTDPVVTSLEWITTPCPVDEQQASEHEQNLQHACIPCRAIKG